MSFISENIIPGKVGKTFLTGINNKVELEDVVEELEKIPGISKIEYSADVYPHELRIWTIKPVPVSVIQEVVQKAGFHAVTRTLLI